MASRMHAGERTIEVALVQRLLRTQQPQWADRPVTPVPSSGTDNALFRLGTDLVVRLPRIGWAVDTAVPARHESRRAPAPRRVAGRRGAPGAAVAAGPRPPVAARRPPAGGHGRA